MNKNIIKTNEAPAAIGPYSQAVKIDKFIYTSGQIPLNPETGELINNIEDATHQCIKNLKAILESADSDLDHIIKTVIFLKDINDFSKVNEVYGSYFIKDQPARSCVQIAKLPKDALIEIEAIAVVK